MNKEAMTYLNEAMDFIQQNSVKREQIDWPALRQEIYAHAEQAQTPAETYSAIQRALESLNDHHSLFLDPAKEQLRFEGRAKHAGVYAIYPEGIVGIVLANSPAEEAGIQVGDCIETLNGQSLTTLTLHQFRTALKNVQLHLTLRSAERDVVYSAHLQAKPLTVNRLPWGRGLKHNIGYLNLPGFVGNPEQGKAYAEAVQQIIREVDQSTTRGWVIDLRLNIGGNMWPMIAGVGPILGEGECFSFVSPNEKITALYRDGQASTKQWGALAHVDVPYQIKSPYPPVAVLTSQLTASSGEFVVLAFQGRAHTRRLGEPTYGIPTGNDDKTLSDGARVILTRSLGADRTGQAYYGPLLPDQYVKTDWKQLGTDSDPVIAAAIQWFCLEKGCL